MENYLIYKYTDKENKNYIGCTNDLNRRIIEHRCSKKYKSLLNAQLKAKGDDFFTITIIDNNLTKDEAYALERIYIKLYDSIYPNGYNLCSGGGKGRRNHNLSNIEHSKVMTGKIQTKEHREKAAKTRQKPVVINSILYPSIKIAAQQLNVSTGYVNGRLRSKYAVDSYYPTTQLLNGEASA